MSVRTNQYLIQGVKLPYNSHQSRYDDYEPYFDDGRSLVIKPYKGLNVIFDGMNGKFIIIGRIIVKAVIDESIAGPIKIPEIDSNTADMIANLINVSFPDPDINFEAVDIGTWIVTHYH